MDRFLQFLIFFTIIISIFGFMQWYVLRSYFRWLRMTTLAESGKRIRRKTIIFFVAANILFFLRIPSTELGWYEHTLFQALIIYPGGIFLGAIVLAFLFLVAFNTSVFFSKQIKNIAAFLTDTPSLVRKMAFKSRPDSVTDSLAGSQRTSNSDPALPTDPALVQETTSSALISRRDFIKTTGTVMTVAPFGITVIASAATAHDYQITRKTLYYPDLPSGLEGFRIAQLSDIHSGIYMTETQMRDIFNLTNEEHPHLIAITGDFVDNSVSEIPALKRALTELKAEYGIFGCLGNHDHYASAVTVSSAMQEQGIHMLTNSHETLTINGETVSLFGVDDHESGTSNQYRIQQATANMPEYGFRVLLSHRPDLFDDARSNNIHLTLAGHTHGGQIGFDFLGVPLYPIHLFHDYAKGLYDFGVHKAYVNVGIGMVGVPVRLVKPELSVLELTGKPWKAAI